MKKPAKEFFWSSDRNPRPYVEDRNYLANIIRRNRRNPQVRVWRVGGEVRMQLNTVVATIRTKREA